MTVWDIIKKRRAITSYKDIPVPQDKWMMVIEAATLAPSAGNIQDWRFIVVTEEDTRLKIAEVCHEQMWMTQAPIHIICCADAEKSKKFYGIRGERLYATQNVAAAIENMLLVATDMGLATNWVGSFEEDRMREILKIPEHIRIQAVVTLGYANEIRPMPQRQPLTAVAFWNEWGNPLSPNQMDLLNYKYAKVGAKRAREGGNLLSSVWRAFRR